MTQTSADWTERAQRTLDVLHQQTGPHSEEHRQQQNDALRRLVRAAIELDEVWTEAARCVTELERQAERVRDETREKADRLEVEQAMAITDLLRLQSEQDLATVLGVPQPRLQELVAGAQLTLADTSTFPAQPAT
jgi:predicted XRE-type DNA-binding protein